MVKIALQISASMENVTGLRPGGLDFQWFFKFKCSSCGEVPDHWQHITAAEDHEVKGGRGHANAVIRCKMCNRENSADIIKESLAAYDHSDANKFKDMVVFDCRGMEPVEFSPRDGWEVKGYKLNSDEDDDETGRETGKVFEDIDLSEDWADYDDKGDESVFISEFKHQFVKVK